MHCRYHCYRPCHRDISFSRLFLPSGSHSPPHGSSWTLRAKLPFPQGSGLNPRQEELAGAVTACSRPTRRKKNPPDSGTASSEHTKTSAGGVEAPGHQGLGWSRRQQPALCPWCLTGQYLTPQKFC